MAVHPYLASKISVVQHGTFPMEGQTLLRAAVTYAIKTPHKIQMPSSPAELTVRDNMIAGGLLLADQLTDCSIFHGFQFIGTDLAILKICPCLLQFGRAEETAHIIIAKGRVCFTHRKPILSYQKIG